MSMNTNTRLIQYKFTHRIYITQHKMHIMGLTGSNTCTHCTFNTTDHYFHAIWVCPPVQQFWKEITTKLSLFFGCSIPLSPSLCILGDLGILDKSQKQITTPLLVALTNAKKTIPLNRKNRKQLTISQWLNLLTEQVTVEQNSALQKKQSEQFNEKYSKLLKSLKLPVS